MKTIRTFATALTSLAVLGAVAQTATAVTLPVTLDLALHLVNAPIVIGSTGSATVNGSGGPGHLQSVALAAGQLVGSALLPVSDPAAAPITGLRVTVANAAGALSETAGGVLRGAMGLPGIAKVCLFGKVGCNSPLANVDVPLTPVGAGGFGVATAAVNLTVIGAPWTTGTAAIGEVTRMGFAQGPASAPSSTGMASGTVQLVTPVYVTTSIAASVVIPVFAVLTMHFVPEPTTLVLLGGGIVALAWAGGRRARS